MVAACRSPRLFRNIYVPNQSTTESLFPQQPGLRENRPGDQHHSQKQTQFGLKTSNEIALKTIVMRSICSIN